MSKSRFHTIKQKEKNAFPVIISPSQSSFDSDFADQVYPTSKYIIDLGYTSSFSSLLPHQIDAYKKLAHFLNDPDDAFARISWPCGTGKSYLLAVLLSMFENTHFLYLTSTHKTCDSFITELEKVGCHDYSHFYGKRENTCKNLANCYFPGCFATEQIAGYINTDHGAICPYRSECLYHKQDKSARIIVTTFEEMNQFPDRVVILDESPENLLVQSLSVPSQYFKLDNLEFDEQIGTYCLNPTPKFTVHNQQTYLCKLLLNQCSKTLVITAANSKNIDLYGFRKLQFSNKIIFACATTTIPFTEQMLGHIDLLLEHADSLRNPVLDICHYGWTLKQTEKYTDLAKRFIESLNGRKFLATKQKIEEHFSCDKVHYGEGRGYNTFEEKQQKHGDYDYIIIYGRFGLPLHIRRIWELFGINQALLDQKEQSEALQCLHRARPLLHHTAKIILMTNWDLLPANIKINLSALELYLQNPPNLSTRDLRKKYKVGGSTVRDYQQLKEFLS